MSLTSTAEPRRSDSLGHAFGAMASDVARDFAAARGVADMDGVFQVKRFNERGKIVGVGVHIVAVPGLFERPWPLRS